MKILISSVLFLISVQANAILAIVDADSFSTGTNLTNTFSGVTLSMEGGAGTVISRDGYSAFNSANLATTGTNVFGYTPVGGPVSNGIVWDQITYGLLRIDFDVYTDFVSIDLIFDDDDIGAIWAYDSMGSLLATTIGSGDGRGPVPSVTASISRSNADIAYVLAGGISAEGLLLDNFKFNLVTVPEPPSLLLLLFAAFMIRRNYELI